MVGAHLTMYYTPSAFHYYSNSWQDSLTLVLIITGYIYLKIIIKILV